MAFLNLLLITVFVIIVLDFEIFKVTRIWYEEEAKQASYKIWIIAIIFMCISLSVFFHPTLCFLFLCMQIIVITIMIKRICHTHNID